MLTGSPISSVNTSPPCDERAGLQHELHGLLDAHEVARHLRVGHRHRAAGRDLAAGTSGRPSRGSRARCRTGPHRGPCRDPAGRGRSPPPSASSRPSRSSAGRPCRSRSGRSARRRTSDGGLDDVRRAEDVRAAAPPAGAPPGSARACARPRGRRPAGGARRNTSSIRSRSRMSARTDVVRERRRASTSRSCRCVSSLSRSIRRRRLERRGPAARSPIRSTRRRR